MKKLATTKNLTYVGILGILAAAITFIGIPLVDGDPATLPNWAAFGSAALAAVTAIMAKGAQSTGGSVAETPEAEARLAAGPK